MSESMAKARIGVVRVAPWGMDTQMFEHMEGLFEWVVERMLYEAKGEDGMQSYDEGARLLRQAAVVLQVKGDRYKREVGGVALIVHGGNEYSVNCQDPTQKPEATFVKRHTYPGKSSFHDEYSLTGGHTGLPISILVLNPRMEPDTYGYSPDYDAVYWLSAEGLGILNDLDDLLWEVYGDVVRNEIREGYRQ